MTAQRPTISLERARELFRYDPDTGVLYRRHAKCEKVGKAKARGYLVVGADKRTYQVHRLAWFMTFGKWPAGSIDHINRIRTDNRLCNLRDVALKVNSRNSPTCTRREQLIGPVPVGNGGGWKVVVLTTRGTRTLGPFATQSKAHEVFEAVSAEAFKTDGRREPKLR